MTRLASLLLVPLAAPLAAQTRTPPPPCWRFVRPVPAWTSPTRCIPPAQLDVAIQYAPITALVNGQRTYRMLVGDRLQLYAHRHGRPLTSVTVDHIR